MFSKRMFKIVFVYGEIACLCGVWPFQLNLNSSKFYTAKYGQIKSVSRILIMICYTMFMAVRTLQAYQRGQIHHFNYGVIFIFTTVIAIILAIILVIEPKSVELLLNQFFKHMIIFNSKSLIF